MEEEIKIGVWNKTSKNGNSYYSGKTTINGQEYYVTVFDNREKKTKEKAPDFNIILKANIKQVVTNQENNDELPF